MLVDAAVTVHIYKSGGIFVLPLSFFQQAAEQCGGSFLLKEDWSQVLFLCRDAVAISFWLQRPEGASHTLVSLGLEDAASIPELVNLWLWKHVNETWDEVRAQFAGTSDVSEYARAMARTYSRCAIPRDAGIN
jgi:hypothetical protein